LVRGKFFFIKYIILTGNPEEGEMNSLKNRRKSERIRCKKNILHNTQPADFFRRGKVFNYSERGLYFESNVDLREEDEISLLVKRHSHGKTHVLDVKIVWCRELQNSSFDVGYGATLKGKRIIDIR
jgi:hypothetical protein